MCSACRMELFEMHCIVFIICRCVVELFKFMQFNDRNTICTHKNDYVKLHTSIVHRDIHHNHLDHSHLVYVSIIHHIILRSRIDAPPPTPIAQVNETVYMANHMAVRRECAMRDARIQAQNRPGRWNKQHTQRPVAFIFIYYYSLLVIVVVIRVKARSESVEDEDFARAILFTLETNFTKF